MSACLQRLLFKAVTLGSFTVYASTETHIVYSPFKHKYTWMHKTGEWFEKVNFSVIVYSIIHTARFHGPYKYSVHDEPNAKT